MGELENLTMEIVILFPLVAFSASIVLILNDLLNKKREVKQSIEKSEVEIRKSKLRKTLSKIRQLIIMNFTIGIIVLVDILFVLLRILKPDSRSYIILSLIFGLFMAAVVIMIIGYVYSYQRSLRK